MSNGGRRPGAGRPKGAVSKANEAARKAASESGETPLQYFLRIMRDAKEEPSRRDDMAKAAAPYIHSKLSSVVMGGDPQREPIKVQLSFVEPKQKR